MLVDSTYIQIFRNFGIFVTVVAADRLCHTMLSLGPLNEPVVFGHFQTITFGAVCPFDRRSSLMATDHMNLRLLCMHTLPKSIPTATQNIAGIGCVSTSLEREEKGPFNENY